MASGSYVLALMRQHFVILSVAVLYLDNLSRDTADAFLADGLTEEIIIRLGQVPRLEVKSHYEVQRFRGQAAQDPATLGRAHVAGDVIDRASSDVLTLESDIAAVVATAVTGHLLPDERTRLTRPLIANAGAYEQAGGAHAGLLQPHRAGAGLCGTGRYRSRHRVAGPRDRGAHRLRCVGAPVSRAGGLARRSALRRARPAVPLLMPAADASRLPLHGSCARPLRNASMPATMPRA
jgi:TolB-like protein